MKKKFLASILAGAIVCNCGTLVFASEKNNNNSTPIATSEKTIQVNSKSNTPVQNTENNTNSKVKETPKKIDEVKTTDKKTSSKKDTPKCEKKDANKVKEKTTSKENKSKISTEDHKEIIRAVEEMREAATLLDNSDLTNKSNIERMDRFSKAALARLENIKTENLPQNFKDNINFVKETGQQIEEITHNINRLLISISNVETVFSRENETLENKNNVLDTLNDVITQEREAGVLNKPTLQSAISTLQKYAAQLPSDDPDSQDKDYDLKEITYAVEEMKQAATLLDSYDLTNKSNVESIHRFTQAALERIKDLPEDKLPNDIKSHLKFIKETAQQVEENSHNINRLLIALSNVETVFSRENETLENKNNVLDTLNDVITQEREAGVLNKPTLQSAISTLQKYAAQLPSDDPESQDKDYNLKQMTYAVEEMREAITLLDTSDFTNEGNYERMIRFVTASLDRARGLDLSRDKELTAHYEWIEESGDSIRNATHNINNLNTLLKNTEKIFNPASHSTEEQMTAAINALEKFINKEEKLGVINKPTLSTARTILNEYAKNIPIKPSEPTTKPDKPNIKPSEPTTKPDKPTTKPSEPTIKPDKPTTKPSEPTIKPNNPNVKSSETTTESDKPTTKESKSTMRQNEIMNKNRLPRTGGHSASGLAGLGIISALIGVFLKK